MIKLFIRNYILFIVVVAVLVIGTILFIHFGQKSIDLKSANTLVRAPFLFVQKQLKQRPTATWKAYINHLQRFNKYQRIELIAYTDLPKLLQHSKLLSKGGIVNFNTDSNPDSQYNSRVAYQKIYGSNQFIRMVMISPKINNVIKNSEWIHITVNELFSNVRAEQYTQAIKKAKDYFGTSVTIKPISTLSTDEKAKLKKWGVLATSSEDNHIQNLSYLINNNDDVITLHKISDPWLDGHPYLSLAILGLALLLIISWIWSYPFYRNLNKLQHQAQQYGNGDLHYRVSMPRQFALSPLHRALNAMGARIQLLIDSHKELTNAIAHEVKTPLARIRFSLGILKDKYQESDTDDIDSMDEDIEILDNLVNELLLHAKFDRQGVILDLQPQSLTKFIKEKIKYYQTKYPQINWQFDYDDEVIALYDRASLSRAIDNLLINAKHYGGDHIHVLLIQDSKISLSIEDNGSGIDPENYDKIFQAFERLSESRQKTIRGHGLGLTICQKIILAHHGQIIVDKSPFGGARFTIELDIFKT